MQGAPSLCLRLRGCARALASCDPKLAVEVLLHGDRTETLRLAGGAVLLLDRARRRPEAKAGKETEPALQAQWEESGVESVDLVVRGVSGDILLEEEEATSTTPISSLVQKLRVATGTDAELVRLCSGTSVLKHSALLGDQVAPSDDSSTLELTFLKLHGPAVTVEAASNRPIKLMDRIPKVGERCHLDRSYRFTSLGSFSQRPSMRYVMTSNDDKALPARRVMWKLNVRMPVVIYLNFRSEMHVEPAREWLASGGWTRSTTIESTVSSGIPNGPYSGPVYFKAKDAGVEELMGSECGEGTYFVFVDIEPDS